MEKAKFVELIQALQSTDAAKRQPAEKMYSQAKSTDPEKLILGMMEILGSADVDMDIRSHNAVLLRGLVAMAAPEKDFIFPRLSAQCKTQVANGLLLLYKQEQDPKLQKRIGFSISTLARYVCDKDDPRGHLAEGGWPELLPLVFGMCVQPSSPEAGEIALRMLKELVATLASDIVAAKQELGVILQGALQSAELKLQHAGLLLVCEIVCYAKKSDWAPLLATAGALVQVMRKMVASQDENMLQEALMAITETAGAEPEFFKQLLSTSMEPATFLCEVTRQRDMPEVRGLALEWLVTYCEKRTKWLSKHLQGYFAVVLEACMVLMLEVDESEEEVAAWARRMDDEEGDEDEDDLYHVGEEAIDRVVKSIEMEAASGPLFALIGQFVKRDEWQYKHAALAAIKQTIEYAEEQTHIDEMGQLLLQHMGHAHPRVRYAALHALGQLANDQSPAFQERSHAQVMPVLSEKMDDPVDKVAAMAMSAFVSFAEQLEAPLMMQYAGNFMEKFMMKLQSTQHRGVREESITSIAVIAGVMEKDFSQYYSLIMPMLKRFVMQATGEKEQRIRGKSFECMSLLGLAVGKEQFLPDAQEAIHTMMQTGSEADETHREYINEAFERICRCLKKDFAQFLPALLPRFLKQLSLDEELQREPKHDEDDPVEVTTSDGKTMTVHSAKFEEVQEAARLLYTFIDETENAYFDYVAQTAEALFPLLTATDDQAYLCAEARSSALHSWSLLVKCARVGAEERGIAGSVLHTTLLTRGVHEAFRRFENEDDPEALSAIACGITECIKSGGVGGLDSASIKMVVEQAFSHIDKSLKRTAAWAKMQKESETGGHPSLADEEGDDADEDSSEEQCRQNLEEVLGAVMSIAPQEFAACLPACGQKITEWLAVKDTRVLALHLACDLIQHLKGASEAVWPTFMPQVMQSLRDKDDELATASIYAVNIAAPLPSFAQGAPEAFKVLAKMLSGPKPKKRNGMAKHKFDNAAAAMLSLAVEKPECCPPGVQAFELALTHMPLREDEEEAKKVHKKLVDLVLQQHQGVLGPDNKNLGKVLSILAEIHHQENICPEELEAQILGIFKMIPTDLLQANASSFTDKQQRKIQKMLMS